MIYHIIAFVGGFILDLILGDPYSLPHPIRWIGSLIGYLERKLNKKDIYITKHLSFLILDITITFCYKCYYRYLF